MLVGEFFELIVGAVLHRVRNKHQRRVAIPANFFSLM